MSFIPGEIYHVYNRGNNKEVIFREDENYLFFQMKMEKELKDCCSILAYALLPNHYHLLVYVPPESGKGSELKMLPISRKLGTLQSSYTQAFNKRFNRSGALFQQRLKRKLATDYADICFHYIHQNPIKAGLVRSLGDWPYSSYNDFILPDSKGITNKDKAYDLLGVPRDNKGFIIEAYGVINDPRLDYLT